MNSFWLLLNATSTTTCFAPTLQGPKKWFAKCDKHYPSRSGQTSLATAVANFTKPRTSHFFDLCKARMEQTDLGIKLGDVYHPYDVTIAIFPGFYAEVV